MRYHEIINEGVDFRPAVKEVIKGETYIGYPEGTTRQAIVPCKWCEGTGKDMQSDAYEKEFGRPLACDACDGKGEVKEWQYDFPQMRMGYMNRDLLTKITGRGDADHGWIPPEEVADVKRMLIRLMNTDQADQMARDPSQERGPAFMDRSGDIPQIRRGALMVDGGMSAEQIRQAGARMLEILNWAQKHGTGVCWA